MGHCEIIDACYSAAYHIRVIRNDHVASADKSSGKRRKSGGSVQIPRHFARIYARADED